MIEEGVHVSSKFLKNDKKLRSAGKKMGCLKLPITQNTKKAHRRPYKYKEQIRKIFSIGRCLS